MINAVHVVTERTPFRGGRFVEFVGMLLCVDCPCAVFDYVYLLFEGDLRSRPEGVADFLVINLLT
eukprot:456517-Pelagomonas_calceolata.AAC.1